MVQYDYALLGEQVRTALQEAFGPNAAVETAEGWHGRVHAKIVSPAFNGLDEERKQTLVWDVLREHLGADAQAVSLVLIYGMDEI